MIYRNLKSWRRAFTLVELVIVILILGILAAGTAPKFNASLRRAQVDGASLRIKADMNLARQTAISRSANQSVKFTVGSAVYTLSGISDPDHPSQAYSVNLADGAYRAVVATASFGGSDTLQFDRYGQPTSAGTVTVSADGVTKAVAVDAATGEVSIP